MSVCHPGEPDRRSDAELTLSDRTMAGRRVTGSEQANASADDSELLQSIRRILSEVNAGPDIGIDIEIPEIPATVSRVYPRNRDVETGEALTRRLGWLATRTAAPRPDAGSFDTEKLRHSHERRVRRIQRARARRRGRGLLPTGLALVSVVAATLAGLYLLHPQIIAASPKLAPAIQQYVETIDRYRAEGGEETAGLRSWLADRLGRAAASES